MQRHGIRSDVWSAYGQTVRTRARPRHPRCPRRRAGRRDVAPVSSTTMSAAFVAAQSALGGMNGAAPVEISRRGASARSTTTRTTMTTMTMARDGRSREGGRGMRAMCGRGCGREACERAGEGRADDGKCYGSNSFTRGGGGRRARGGGVGGDEAHLRVLGLDARARARERERDD